MTWTRLVRFVVSAKKENQSLRTPKLPPTVLLGERSADALYNLNSGLTVEAPIKSQCSRDYFYTKNPFFEENFSKIEGEQKRLLSDIIASQSVPAHDSFDRRLLSIVVMVQAGRTATAVADADHLTNQFGKAWLRCPTPCWMLLGSTWTCPRSSTT